MSHKIVLKQSAEECLHKRSRKIFPSIHRATQTKTFSVGCRPVGFCLLAWSSRDRKQRKNYGKRCPGRIRKSVSKMNP